MSYSLSYATIIGKKEFIELDAEPLKEFYNYVHLDGKKIIADKQIVKTKPPESFWPNYSLSNPDKIIIETYYSNKVCPSTYGISVLYNGYEMAYIWGIESFYPCNWCVEIAICDRIKDRTYKASETQILFYLLKTLKTWDFNVTDEHGNKTTSKEIAKRFIEYLYEDPRINASIQTVV